MKMNKWFQMGLATLALAAFSATGQDRAPGGGGRGGQQGGQQGGRGGGFSMEQMQKYMNDRIKKTLEMSDEEWKAIEPMINEVNKARSSARGHSTMGRGGPGGGRDADPNAAPTPESELTKLLENKAASSADIKVKLDALRAKREADEETLKKAQDTLREVLTVRQEAQLVLMGILK
jgi:hypothetical protein